jgi:hypothetical protein
MIKNMISIASPCARVTGITSLLIVLFCLFKSECYCNSLYPAIAAPRPACELVLPTLPRHSIPQLIENRSSGSETVPVAMAACPLNGRPFSALQREYALFVDTILHLYGNSTFVACLHRQPHLFKFFQIDSFGDIPFNFFS